MKRMKSKMKKGMAKLLTAIMVIGLLPMMPSNMATVHAAEPSSTAYATKEELMNWDYQNTVGKIVFGKDSSGNAMEWYILGSDSGVSGDNTVIFAASPIVSRVKFEDDHISLKAYQEGFGTYQTTVTKVYPNHYGASDLRVTLNNIATDNNYFTAKEQSLLLRTQVITTDTKNYNNTTYTTDDILYALHGDYDNNNTTLYAGSNNDKALAMSTYWGTGDRFWLRTPHDLCAGDALAAGPGLYVDSFCVDSFYVDLSFGVQPASNLNLSSVIFASAAPAASSDAVKTGTISSGKAMTLRLDGSTMDIGNVIYDSAQSEQIFVEKSANATGTVSLVVQGNDGSTDWYYSKVITGTEIIRMADIKTALNLSADISVDDCEIWLETTVDGMAYAKQMQNVIYTLNISIDAPAPGEALASDVTVQNTGVVSTSPAIKWTVGATDATGTAEYDTAYTVTMNFTTTDSAYFDDPLTATVNGETATITKNTDGTVTVSYTFPAIEKDKLISITQPQRLTVANGTAYEDMNLPAMVDIETDKGNVTQAAVTWNTAAPIDGSYDPTILTEQTVILKGTVTCPDSVDANGVTLETKISITISAAVETPFIMGDDGKMGWDAISDEIADAETGDEVVVDMNGATVVPGDIIEEARDKDITITFVVDEDVSWTIDGGTVADGDIRDIDFGTTIESEDNPLNNIPVDVINNITGEKSTIEVNLAYSGEFGFTAVLTTKLSSANAGYYANLFYYNPTSKRLEYVCADVIASDGTAELTFTHASDYLIVIDDEDLGVVKADVTTTETITDKNTDDSAKTGDNTPLAAVMVMMMISVMGLIFGNKKKRNA